MRTVADFYGEIMTALGELGMRVRILRRPVEMETTIPFDEDAAHASGRHSERGRLGNTRGVLA